MFGWLLLETRLAVIGVLSAAFVEAAGLLLVSRRVTWVIPAGDRYRFVRQRLSLAFLFGAGIMVYAYLKDIYLYDPFFQALYTFLVAFFLFYYATSLATAVAVLLAGGQSLTAPSPVPFLAAALVLLAVTVAKPQVSVFGFFCGAAAHLVGRYGRPRGRFGHLWFVVGMALLLFIVLTRLSR